MTTLEDNIITRYRQHPKTGPEAETKEFRQLSKQFHEVFRLCVARAKLKGWIS
jgi:hypothetical protein